MKRLHENNNLGPRARILNLQWKNSKTKRGNKKKKVQSHPKRQKKDINKHDPRTKSINYSNVERKSINEGLWQQPIQLMKTAIETPDIIIYEVEYLDNE